MGKEEKTHPQNNNKKTQTQTYISLTDFLQITHSSMPWGYIVLLRLSPSDTAGKLNYPLSMVVVFFLFANKMENVGSVLLKMKVNIAALSQKQMTGFQLQFYMEKDMLTNY